VVGISISIPDYKSLRVTVTIWAILVNTLPVLSKVSTSIGMPLSESAFSEKKVVCDFDL